MRASLMVEREMMTAVHGRNQTLAVGHRHVPGGADDSLRRELLNVTTEHGFASFKRPK
jgi:hypothetical protein